MFEKCSFDIVAIVLLEKGYDTSNTQNSSQKEPTIILFLMIIMNN